MKFDPEELADIIYDIGKYERISDEHVESDRWSELRCMIFQRHGRYYRCHYSLPLTELQETDLFLSDPVECPEVYPVKQVITVYETEAETHKRTLGISHPPTRK